MNNSLFKKVGASFVALTLAFSCTSAVSATGNNSEFTPSVTYSKGDYTFGKISHPDKAQATTDGLVDYLGGGKVGVQVKIKVQLVKEIRDRAILGLLLVMEIGCMLVLAMQHQAVRFN